MLFALCVIAFAMMFGGGPMRFGGVLVVSAALLCSSRAIEFLPLTFG
jgi:hypothetical protein